MYDVTIDIYEEGTLSEAFSSGSIDNDKILFTLMCLQTPALHYVHLEIRQ